MFVVWFGAVRDCIKSGGSAVALLISMMIAEMEVEGGEMHVYVCRIVGIHCIGFPKGSFVWEGSSGVEKNDSTLTHTRGEVIGRGRETAGRKTPPSMSL